MLQASNIVELIEKLQPYRINGEFDYNYELPFAISRDIEMIIRNSSTAYDLHIKTPQPIRSRFETYAKMENASSRLAFNLKN